MPVLVSRCQIEAIATRPCQIRFQESLGLITSPVEDEGAFPGRARANTANTPLSIGVTAKEKRTAAEAKENSPISPIFHAEAPFLMLSESFVASTLSSAKTPSATLRDVGICVQEFQPAPQLRSTFKKSSTTANCLAVSPSHIFSAQAEKAVAHVYSREKGNQEALVPFPERIRSIAVAGGKYGDVLILGTEGGRLILWEV